MDSKDRLRIRQIDASLSPLKGFRQPPPGGWVKVIRKALGMSVRQLSRRAGLSPTSVRSVEMHEAKGTVRLDSLAKLAQAMDCQLVYAIVPNDTLALTVEKKAERIARQLVRRVADSMELEAQGGTDEFLGRQVEEMKNKLLRGPMRHLWDV